VAYYCDYPVSVSIHAFRGEGDGCAARRGERRVGFNPRLPGGRRLSDQHHTVCRNQFQSTPSGGKATDAARSSRRIAGFQSTPSGGKATGLAERIGKMYKFQSTPSGGKATDAGYCVAVGRCVSIHAFRGEGDRFRCAGCARNPGFNPRLPGGRRRSNASASHSSNVCFNPRLPGGRRQPQQFLIRFVFNVSIHAFRGEGDRSSSRGISVSNRFNPRLPGGRRLVPADRTDTRRSFNPRLPGGRRPPASRVRLRVYNSFNPRLPGGRRLYSVFVRWRG